MQQDILLNQVNIPTNETMGILYFDLSYANGDFAISNSDNQTIEQIIQSFAGWFKTDFINGVGIIQYLNDRINQQTVQLKIKNSLIRDGFSVKNVTFDKNNNIYVNAERL